MAFVNKVLGIAHGIGLLLSAVLIGVAVLLEKNAFPEISTGINEQIGENTLETFHYFALGVLSAIALVSMIGLVSLCASSKCIGTVTMILALILSLISMVIGIVYLSAAEDNFPFSGDIRAVFKNFVTSQGKADVEKAFNITCSTDEECATKLCDQMEKWGTELGWTMLTIGGYELGVFVLSIWFLCTKQRE